MTSASGPVAPGSQTLLRDMGMTVRHFDLLWYKTLAELRAEAARTYVGFLWWVLDPILFMMIFYLVFGVLLERGGEHFVQFLLIGLVAWRWFHSTLTHGCNALPAGRGLIRQVYLPKVLLPLVDILSDLIKFGVVLLLLLAFLWWSGFGPRPSWLALPLLVLVQLLLITGLTLLAAALMPFLPDLKQLITHTLQMLFFMSGIFYDASRIPAAYRDWFFLNPMAFLIDAWRTVLMHGAWPAWSGLAVILIGSCGLIALACAVLRRYDRIYPKLILG